MAQKIFLSYKREDNKDGFVEKLYKRLKAAGYDVWWDMQSMPQRQLSFLQEIRDAVAAHDRLILVGSIEAYNSPYVKAEFKYALSICKPVHLILRADDYENIPAALSQLDAPDFRDDANFEKAFDHLLRHLEEDAAPLGDIHGSRPALPAWYIERDNIMGELENRVLIDSRQPVVVTSKQQVSALHGMGGIGKTTVANAFSERCATRRYFPDGIFWVQLGKNPDITFQQANIGKIFGDDPKEYLSPEKGLARLQALLSNKRVLFVLDDVWEKDHADAFRVQGNFTRILITTRQQDLVTQLTAMSAEVDKLTVEEGLRLFDARLGRVSGTNRPYYIVERQIIELLDGYTLAVELASAQLFNKGEDYAPRLLQRLQKKRITDNPFSDLELEGDAKSESLEISLAISYEELTEDEKHRFRVLGVLAPNAPFTYELMQALYADEDDSITEDNLDTLQNMALLTFGKAGIYIQHSVLRNYALALLKHENEYEANYHFYLKYITERAEEFKKDKPEEWHKLDEVIPHVIYVGDTLTKSYQSDKILSEIAYKFALNTKNYVIRRMETYRRHWLEMGFKLAQEKNDIHRQAVFLNALGVVYNALSGKEQALNFFTQALLFLQQVGDISGKGSIFNNIGHVYDALGKKEQALDFYNQALLIRREIGDKSGEAITLNNIGSVYNDLGNKQQALDFYNQALPMHKNAGNKVMEAKTLDNIGSVYDALGKKEQALDFYNQALPIRREVGDKSGEAITLSNIGIVYNEFGNKQQALNFYNQALPMHKNVGDISGEANTLNNIGDVYSALGDKQQALDFYSQALSLRRQVGDISGEASILNNIGLIYSALGDKQQALHFYNQALPIHRRVGDISGEATTLSNIGAVYSALGDKQQALHFYNQALPIYQQVGDKSGEATTLNNIGHVYSTIDDWQKALGYLYQALNIIQQIGDRFNEFACLANIAVTYHQQGKIDESINYMSKSVELGEKVSHPDTKSARSILTNWQNERDSGA